MVYVLKYLYLDLDLDFEPKRVAMLVLVFRCGLAALGKMLLVSVHPGVDALDGVLSRDGVHASASAPRAATRTRRVHTGGSQHEAVLCLGPFLLGTLARVSLLMLLDLLQHTVQTVADLTLFTRKLFLELFDVQAKRFVLTRL